MSSLTFFDIIHEFYLLFQLIFTFIYNTFNKKNFNFNKISGSQTNHLYQILMFTSLFMNNFVCVSSTRLLNMLKNKV